MGTDQDLVNMLLEKATEYGIFKFTDGLLGQDIEDWGKLHKKAAEEKIQNFLAILGIRRTRANQQGKTVSNDIPIRIVERVFNEGSYSTHHVNKEYYAGVILTTQEDAVDDEGVFYLSTIQRLSSKQLRAHYILYQVIKEVFDGSGHAGRLFSRDAKSGLTCIDAKSFLEALKGEEEDELSALLDDFGDRIDYYQAEIEHVLQGLRKENLIRVLFVAGESEEESPNASPMFNDGYSSRRKRATQKIYYFFAPTLEGLMLYLWGRGYGKIPYRDFLNKGIICPRIEEITINNFFDYYNGRDHFVDADITEFAQRKFPDM